MTKPVRLVRKSRASSDVRGENELILIAADVGSVADCALGAAAFVSDPERIRRLVDFQGGDLGLVGAPDFVPHNEGDGAHQFAVAAPDIPAVGRSGG